MFFSNEGHFYVASSTAKTSLDALSVTCLTFSNHFDRRSIFLIFFISELFTLFFFLVTQYYSCCLYDEKVQVQFLIYLFWSTRITFLFAFVIQSLLVLRSYF